MHPATEQAITEVEFGPGSLSFIAAIGGGRERVYFETETPLQPTADAALVACLLPAMRHGGALRVEAPVSPRLLRRQLEYQAVQRSWSLDWTVGEPPLLEVEVQAPARAAERGPLRGRVAAFFSGGVDSWSMLVENPDVTDLVFVRGFDLHPTDPARAELRSEVEERLRAAAAETGLPLHVVETNLRQLADRHLVWDCSFGCAVAAVGLFLAPLFDRVLIAGDSDYETQERFGPNWLVDHLLGTEELEIEDCGGRFSRAERTARVGAHPPARRSLRVCWENRDGAYNCGRCRKCLMTMTTLEALGLREGIETFPPQLDLEAVAALQIRQPVLLNLWEDVLDAARRAGRGDLERAVAPVVASGRDRLGLPLGYRRRHDPGPPPVAAAAPPPAAPAAPSTALYASAETAAAIAAAPGLCLLVGGYDGSGNFGDVAMVDAALGALAPLAPAVLAVPVIERAYAASHRLLAGQMRNPPQHVVYFDAGGEHDDELVPVPAPGELRVASCQLYGGGYLNGFWGARKLAMLAAAEALLAAGGTERIRRVATGLQVEPEWLATLDSEDRQRLAGFELLGARDAYSAWALERLGLAMVVETGDDAVGLLRSVEPARAPTGEGPLRVNVHVSEGEWVSSEPARGREFQAELVAALARLRGRPALVQPTIAYLDLRVDERPAVERLTAELAARGVEVAEPLVLRPGSLPADAGVLARAELTLSRSYHVAFASLMIGVPAVLVADNPYLAQKSTGLREAFELPAAFAPNSGEDPAAAAAALAAALGGEEGAALRLGLARGAGAMRRRRELTEAELLHRLGAGPPAPEPAPAEGRLPAPPAIRAENARRVWAAEGRLRESERRADELEARLGELLGSRSWRLTAPLRGFRAAAKR